MDFGKFLGAVADQVGTALNAPGIGLSEFLAGGNTKNTGRINEAGLARVVQTPTGTQRAAAGSDVQAVTPQLSGSYNAGGSGAGGSASAADLAYLNDNQNTLQSLLNRTNTGQSQALQRIADAYNQQLTQANADKERQYAAYDDKTVETNKGKLGAYDTLNKNAGNAYRSLAQIIGRSAGTGSSAFQDLLPDVVGKDTSSKRQDLTDTYGENLASIDKARKNYDLSFQGVLEDLMNQRRGQEESALTSIEQQRQDINNKLSQNAAQLAQARGGGYAAVKAASQPFNSAIENSRNNVENFFNQFRAQYTPRAAVAENPDLAAYTVDRSAINAQNSGGQGENPYSQLIRRRLEQGGIA